MKPTLRSFFSGAPVCGEHLGRGLDREELRQRGKRGRGADRFQEGAARHVLREHRAHHGGRDHALVALLFAFDRLAAQRPRGMLMLGGRASADRKRSPAGRVAIGIEGIVERGHAAPLCHTGRGERRCPPRPVKIPSAPGRALRRRAHDKHAGSMPPCPLRGQPSAGPARSAAPDRATTRSRSRNTSARPSRRRSSARGRCWRRARP